MSLAVISNECEAKSASILSLYLIRVPEVAFMPLPVNQVISDNILLQGGQQWYRWSYRPETCEFRETPKLSKYGTMYEISLTCVIPPDKPTTNDQMNQLRDSRLMALYVDGLGRVKVLGHPDHPLTFTEITQVDSKSTGLNGYTVNLKGLVPRKSPFYTGIVTGYTLLQFWIDAQGFLNYDNTANPGLTASLSSGTLTLTGTEEANYSLNSDKEIIYTP